MPGTGSYRCGTCGRWHDEVPFAYHALAPAYWSDELTRDVSSVLGEEQCIVRGEHFFVRARVVLPVLDAEEDFEWGVWVSLSEASFARMDDLWDTEGRERQGPCFGWLSSELPYRYDTLELAVNVHTQPLGARPLVELEPTDHPLAIEQRDGITLARVRQIAEVVLHGGGL